MSREFEYTFTENSSGQNLEITAKFYHWMELEGPINGQIKIDSLTAHVDGAYAGRYHVDVSNLLESVLIEKEINDQIMDAFHDWHDTTPE